MPYRIVYTSKARDHLNDLYFYLAAVADADVGQRYVDGIIDRIDTLADFPRRGTPRDEIRAGLRTIPWKKRVTIAFMIEDAEVTIVGVSYGGRDIEALLAES